MPLTKIFDREDTHLYSTWHLEAGGIVELLIPMDDGDVLGVRMTLAKAEEISNSIMQHAQYGRWAAMEQNAEAGKDIALCTRHGNYYSGLSECPICKLDKDDPPPAPRYRPPASSL
jgi:hypothetical protein